MKKLQYSKLKNLINENNLGFTIEVKNIIWPGSKKWIYPKTTKIYVEGSESNLKENIKEKLNKLYDIYPESFDFEILKKFNDFNKDTSSSLDNHIIWLSDKTDFEDEDEERDEEFKKFVTMNAIRNIIFHSL